MIVITVTILALVLVYKSFCNTVLFMVMQIKLVGVVVVVVHTTPEKFENAALFLRLGLPCTLIRQDKGAFQKRSSNLKTPVLRFMRMRRRKTF